MFSHSKHMPDPLPLTGLADALRPSDHELIALVGGGGKTTTLFALGRQLAPSVVLTTTTKMGTSRTEGHEPLIAPRDIDLRAALERDGVVLAWRGRADHRAVGFDPEVCDAWFDLARHVVVEADGSRRRPFKAPAPHEPVVPSRTSMLIACVGAGAFGGVIADCCHRPDAVAHLARCGVDDRLTPRRIAAVLTAADGSRRACPPDARFVVVVNRVTPADVTFATELCDCLPDDVSSVLVEAFDVPEPHV